MYECISFSLPPALSADAHSDGVQPVPAQVLHFHILVDAQVRSLAASGKWVVSIPRIDLMDIRSNPWILKMAGISDTLSVLAA